MKKWIWLLLLALPFSQSYQGDFTPQHFGATAAGIGTDDQPAFQAAVNAAHAGHKSVFIPCGEYGMGRPLVLPRTASGAYTFGTVNLIAEAMNCVELRGMATFPVIAIAITGATETGNTVTYTASVALPVSFISGVTVSVTGMTPQSYDMACFGGITVTSGTTFTCPSNFSGLLPSTSAGKATLATGMIQWEATPARTLGQQIKNITFQPPSIEGVFSILYAYTSATLPITSFNADAERADRWVLSDLEFLGSNQYAPADVYLQGVCTYCNISNLTDNSSIAAGGYANNNFETVLLRADTCYLPTSPFDETCGMYESILSNINGGTFRGGKSPAFQGRLNGSSFTGGFCNGMSGAFSNSQCFAFLNSAGSQLFNITNEGLGDRPQILFSNSTAMTVNNLGTGTPGNTGYGIGDGIDLVNTTRSIFYHKAGGTNPANSFSGQQVATKVTVTKAGNYTGTAPTAASTGGACAATPTYTITLAANAISSVTVTNGGNCGGKLPTITLTCTGSCKGGGGVLTPVFSTTGTYFALKLDAQSHNNQFWDFGQVGTGEFSVSDLGSNYIQTCDNASSGCYTKPYRYIGCREGCF